MALSHKNSVSQSTYDKIMSGIFSKSGKFDNGAERPAIEEKASARRPPRTASLVNARCPSRQSRNIHNGMCDTFGQTMAGALMRWQRVLTLGRTCRGWAKVPLLSPSGTFRRAASSLCLQTAKMGSCVCVCVCCVVVGGLVPAHNAHASDPPYAAKV